MKKSPLSEFFLIFKPGSRKNQNGNGLLEAADPISLRRLPIAAKSKAPSPVLPIFLSLLIVAGAVAFFVGMQGLHRHNQTLIKEIKRNRALIQQIQKERDELKSRAEKIKEENISLQAQIKKSEETANTATEEKTYLEEMLINKSKEIEQFKNQAPAAAVPSDQIEQRLSDKGTELKRLVEQNRILSQKLQKLYTTTNQKISEINVAKITLEETITEARKAIDNEWNLVDLGSISANPASAAKTNRPEARKFPKKEGKILAINEDHGFVIVDIGKVDGVKNDTILDISQNGQTIGKLKVLEIRDVMTACNILDLSSGRKIQLNDPVLIQK